MANSIVVECHIDSRKGDRIQSIIPKARLDTMTTDTFLTLHSVVRFDGVYKGEVYSAREQQQKIT